MILLTKEQYRRYARLYLRGDVLQVEPTTRCDLACSNCLRPEQPPPIVDLVVPTLNRIMDNHRRISVIRLQGLGEPFLHPDFGTICRAALKRAPVHVTTNALHMQEIPPPCVSYITVSLDTLDPDLAVAMKGRNYDLGTVLDNLGELRRAWPASQLDVNFVRSAENAAEEEGVRAYCRGLGVQVSVVPVQNWHYPGERGYKEAQAKCLMEHHLRGNPVPRFNRYSCAWLHDEAFYYDALGRRHRCCIRMGYDQLEMDPEKVCTTCPD